MHGWWTVSYVVLWLLVVALTTLVLALARQVGTLHLRLGPRGALEIDDEGPPLGEAPQPTELESAGGGSILLGGGGPERLVLFVSPSCPVCREVAPSLAPIARAGGLEPLVVADVDDVEAGHLRDELRTPAPIAHGAELAGSWAVPGTPYAVVLDRWGVVRAKGTVNSLEQLEGLVDTGRRRTDEALAEASR